MNIFNNIRDKMDRAAIKLSKWADDGYRWLLPKTAKEYAKAGFWSGARLVKDLVVDTVAGAGVVVKSLALATPDGLRSAGHFIKGVFWDAPKAAYHRYQQSQWETQSGKTAKEGADIERAAAERALRATEQDFSQMGNHFAGAVSTVASTAWQGLSPLVVDAITSTAYNGGELVVDTAAVVAIGVVEGVKFTANQVVAPTAARLAESSAYLVERMARATSDLTAPNAPQPQALLGNGPSPIINISYQGKRKHSLSSLVEKVKTSASDEAAIRLAILQTGAAIAGG